MSLYQHVKRTRRALTHALVVNYGRYMPYSPTVDRINRRPLLQSFVEKNHNAPSFATRESMWSFIADRSPTAIDYLEFGVHEGHSILYFATQNKAPDSRFFGFDSFTGLPEDWNSDFKRGHFDTDGRGPETADTRVKFVAGLFQDTLPKFLSEFKPTNRLIVNIDCDLYTSALYCLTKLDPILRKGTILMFDEFGELLHEFRAANDYLSSYRRDAKVICSHDDFYTVAVELQ
jgi:O-methyltransferase